MRELFRISVENRDYHHLSQSEIDGGKRIYRHLSSRVATYVSGNPTLIRNLFRTVIKPVIGSAYVLVPTPEEIFSGNADLGSRSHSDRFGTGSCALLARPPIKFPFPQALPCGVAFNPRSFEFTLPMKPRTSTRL
jgi:hypothetical protein